jgi:hypothetical protein
MTAKIRYIGEEKTTRAFGKTWVRSLWNDKHALPDEHVDILAQNPRFQVVKEGEPEPKDLEPKPED